MAKLQIDGIEIAEIDAAKAVRVLRLVRDNGPGLVMQAEARRRALLGAKPQGPLVEISLPLTFAPLTTSARKP